jgi:ABC-type taurine transport system substrate-binding protein
VSLVVLDTDAASALLRRRDTAARLPNPLVGRVVAVTFVTVGEMTTWTLVRHWGQTAATPFDASSTAS